MLCHFLYTYKHHKHSKILHIDAFSFLLLLTHSAYTRTHAPTRARYMAGQLDVTKITRNVDYSTQEKLPVVFAPSSVREYLS